MIFPGVGSKGTRIWLEGILIFFLRVSSCRSVSLHTSEHGCIEYQTLRVGILNRIFIGEKKIE